ncbi:unnamed protein product [Heterobilharzia americana]|nr:unnamed protein product [Heterobilharzia americana]
MVINVLKINLVSKFTLFIAPILREPASVNSLECNSITRNNKYNLKNIGTDRIKSMDTILTEELCTRSNELCERVDEERLGKLGRDL